MYDFKHILNDFIHTYSPGQGQKTPWGQNYLLQVLNRSLWILILYTFFNVFPHVYSPGAGADNPLWTKSWCQQKSLVTLPICCKFQNNIFEVWFYTQSFMFLYMHIAPGRADNPLGSEFLYKHKSFVTLVICCKFLPLNDFLTVFPIQKHKRPNLALP